MVRGDGVVSSQAPTITSSSPTHRVSAVQISVFGLRTPVRKKNGLGDSFGK